MVVEFRIVKQGDFFREFFRIAGSLDFSQSVFELLSFALELIIIGKIVIFVDF